MGPAWTDLGILFGAADTMLPSVYWPWLVDTATVPGVYPRRYRLYYSTDHDQGIGGIAYAEADTPHGPWTHHPAVYVDTTLGDSTETPAVVYVPDTGLWHLYYQQAGVELGQRTMLATSVDGVSAWTRRGVALSIPPVSGQPDLRWPGEQIHTGYAIPHRLPGGRWLMFHLLAGGDHPHFGVSWSGDGVRWQIDPRPLGYGTHQVGAGRRIEWNTSYLLDRDGVLWWVGTVCDFVSATEPRVAQIAQGPIGPDFRTLLAPPRPVLLSGNIRAINVSTDAEGVTWLLYQLGDQIGLAVAS